MSDDNGFVERPTARSGKATSADSLQSRVIATADNGKAIQIRVGQLDYAGLRRRGFRLHTAIQPDGRLLAWCERIEAPAP